MLFVEVRLLPKPDRAWCLPTKSRVGSVEDSKVGFTATLVVPAVWGRPTHLQVCLNGLTSRCHPLTFALRLLVDSQRVGMGKYCHHRGVSPGGAE